MALVGLDLDEGDRGAAGVERMDDGPRFGGGVKPVRGEGNHAEAGPRASEGAGERAAVILRQIEIIAGAGDIEIGIGVEPVDEGRALMAQIILDLEIGVEGKGGLGAVLQFAAEFALQRLLRQIGDMGGHARDAEALDRAHAYFEVTPAAPVRIGHDRLAPDLVEGDILRGMARGGGDRHGREHPLGINGGPLQHLHAAHRAACHAEKRVDAQTVDQHGLGADHVGDGDHGEIEAIGAAGRRVERGRSGGAHAAAEHIRADDEIFVGVEGFSRADQRRPPAGLAGQRMNVGDMLVAGQRMAEQDRVGLVGVQLAIGLVGDGEGLKRRAGTHGERLRSVEHGDLAVRLRGFGQAGVGFGRRVVQGAAVRFSERIVFYIEAALAASQGKEPRRLLAPAPRL